MAVMVLSLEFPVMLNRNAEVAVAPWLAHSIRMFPGGLVNTPDSDSEARAPAAPKAFIPVDATILVPSVSLQYGITPAAVSVRETVLDAN